MNNIPKIVENVDCTITDDILPPSNLDTDADSSLSFINSDVIDCELLSAKRGT